MPARFCLELASVCLVGVGVWLAARHWHRLGWKCMAGWYLLRLAITAVVVFAIGRSIHSDLEEWMIHAMWMVQGAVPGVDFHTPYSYGFNMLLKLCAMPNGTQFQLVVLFMLAEWAALTVLYSALRTIRGECVAKRCVILYLTSPLYMTVSCTWAQDETLCLLAVSLMIWCALRRDETMAVMGMALVAGAGIFFTKILVVYYFAPFLLLRRWKGAFAATGMFIAYLVTVRCFGINPFDLEFSHALGMESASGGNVLNLFSAGNVWSVLRGSVPHALSGAICFVMLTLTGILYLPAALSRDADVAKRFDVACEWSCAWIFVFNIFYTLTFATYILPVVPFMVLFVLDQAGERRKLTAVSWMFVSWLVLKIVEVYARWIIWHVSKGSSAAGLLNVLLGMIIFAMSCAGLALVLSLTRHRFMVYLQPMEKK